MQNRRLGLPATGEEDLSMNRTHDIFLRVHTVLKGKKRADDPEKERSEGKHERPQESAWPIRILCFDCESLIDVTQKLTFGSYRVCRLVDGRYLCEEEGLFYADDLPAPKRKVLEEYVRNEYADIEVKSFTPKIRIVLRSRAEFVEKVFYKAILDKAMIVGFFVIFDLARLAVDWAISEDGGWSLTLAEWFNPKTKSWQEHPYRPRITYKALNSKTALIHSTRARRSSKRLKNGKWKLWPQGRFLDVRTLLWALANKSYSLKSAAKAFKLQQQKVNHTPTGDVTKDEIAYCRGDVKTTLGILNDAAKVEYDLHPIAKFPDQLYSPASVAKGYLERLQITHPREKFIEPDYAFGIAMQAYMGGRAESRIRKCEVPVVPVDYMSQYSACNELLSNWDILTAESITFEDATESVRKLVQRITLDQCFNRKLWSGFKFFALVKPTDDILPMRTVFSGVTQNIGINYLRSDEPVWFAGPDVISAIILSGGKVPHIGKAYRLVPHGKQAGLGITSLRSMVAVDAAKTSFFKHVVEQRAANEANKSLHYFLKVLASSGSYGLFVELNPAENNCDLEVQVFSGEDMFTDTPPVIEKPGDWFFAPIGSLITSSGRLLLALLEACVEQAGGTYLFCDTDSLCIVSSKKGGRLRIPGAKGKRVLRWDEVDAIAKRFESLNPYDLPGSILKVHKLNKDEKGNQRQLYGYGLASKRYAIYEKTRGGLKVVEPKAHGLGYFHSPIDSPEGWEKDHDVPKWIFDMWDYIIRGALKLKRKKPDWFNLPVLMRLTLSTPHHALQNLGKSDLTRPHNFMMMPKIAPFGYPPGVNPASPNFTLITSFTSKREEWMKSKCINIHDHASPEYRLKFEYCADGVSVSPVNFCQLVDSYQNHPEAKSLGPDGEPCGVDTRGLLQRAHIVAGDHIKIGKESDRHWEQGEDVSLLEFKAVQYRRRGKAIATDEQLHRILVVPKREFIRRGINQHTLEKVCRKEPVRISRLAKMLKVLEQWESERDDKARTSLPGR